MNEAVVLRVRAAPRLAWLLGSLWPLVGAAQPTAPATAGPGSPAASPQRIEIDGQARGADDERRQSLEMKTVIGRDELDEYGDVSVLDVLQRVPGIGIDGEQPRLRGMGGGYTQILINGEPAPPGFSLEQLAPADIERIEIVKGPSAEFGGVAGTINVILRTPPRLTQRELRATLSHRSLRPGGGLNASWGDRVGALSFHLPISAYQWAGANRSDSQRSTRDSAGQLRVQDLHIQDQWHGGGVNLGPRVEWKASDVDTLQWQGFAQRNETGNANQRQWVTLLGVLPSITDDRTRARGVWEVLRTQLQWTRRWPEGQRLETRLSQQHSAGRSLTRYEGLAGSSAPLLRETESTNEDERRAGSVKWRQPLGESHVLVIGTDIDHSRRHELRRVFENGAELVTTSQGVPFDVTRRRAVAFVQDEWTPLPRVSALLGLRGESLRTEASSIDGIFTTHSRVLTPVVQGRWAFDAKGRELLRGSVSRATRLPDLGSLMGRYVLNTTYDRNTANTPLAADSAGNPNLAPERALALELALETYPASGGVLSVSVFHRRIDDLIRRRIGLESVPEATVPRWVSRPVNFGRATSSGMELELKGRGDELLPWLLAPRSPVNLRASLSLYRSRVEQVDDPDARLEGQPPWQTTLGFDHSPRPTAGGQGFSFGANLAYTPGFLTRQTDLQRIRRSPTRRIDAYLLWRLDRQTQARLSVQNAVPRDAVTWSATQDVDGFNATNQTRRPNQAQVNLNLVTRF